MRKTMRKMMRKMKVMRKMMRKMKVMRKISQEKSLQSRIRRQDQTLLHPIKSVELNHQIERHSSPALNSTIRFGAQEERRLTRA